MVRLRPAGFFLGVLSYVGLACGFDAARAEEQPVRPKPAPTAAPSSGLDLSNFDYEINDGLYATVTCLSQIKNIPAPPETKITLRQIEGFKRDLEVQAAWQAGPAPLVVILPGIFSKVKSPINQIWRAQLYAAGNHVLYFDSPFLPAFNERAHQGVAGNIEKEALQVAAMLGAFLRQPDVRAKVTKLGVVGGSYGGNLALSLAKLCKEGKCAFTPDVFLVFSPLVKLQTTLSILDRYYSEDRFLYDLSKLSADLQDPKPLPRGAPIPFPASEMRAGIGAYFRMDLKDVALYTDAVYRLKVLPPEEEVDYRKASAEALSFSSFMEKMSFPYWKKRGAVSSLDQLSAFGDLTMLLPACPPTVKVVIAVDDPLNDPTEFEALKGIAPPGMLTVLPRGGHMGFIISKWAETRIVELLK